MFELFGKCVFVYKSITLVFREKKFIFKHTKLVFVSANSKLLYKYNAFKNHCKNAIQFFGKLEKKS